MGVCTGSGAMPRSGRGLVPGVGGRARGQPSGGGAGGLGGLRLPHLRKRGWSARRKSALLCWGSLCCSFRSEQGFTTSAFWTGGFPVVEATLCLVACVAASLASTYEMSVAPFPSLPICDNQNCPRRNKIALLRTTVLKDYLVLGIGLQIYPEFSSVTPCHVPLYCSGGKNCASLVLLCLFGQLPARYVVATQEIFAELN